MEVIFDLDDIQLDNESVAVTMGTFDGIHLGHRKVIESLVSISRERNLKSAVISFSNNPKEVITGEPVSKIMTLEEKMEIFSSFGIDYLVLAEFDEKLMNTSAGDFFNRMILDRMNLTHLVMGHDFRFGKNAEGNENFLRTLSAEHGFDLDYIEPLLIDGERISSTRIRELLSEGNVEEASKLLGRDHYYRSTVIEGKRLGGKIGFPTLNLLIDHVMHTLRPGVYITTTKIGDEVFGSVTNIGFNPTFKWDGLKLETYVLDFSRDLYGREIVVSFKKRIRDELAFDSLKELIDAITEDVDIARKYFINKKI